MAELSLEQRIGRNDPSRYRRHEGSHRGVGALQLCTLLDSTSLDANLVFVHRGQLLPGSGIGHHFHNTVEEMFIIFDNEAEFTIDGRTSALTGPVGAPCRRGHSHAIYNRSDRPTEWMNINVSLAKDRYDAVDLGDSRVDAPLDEIPVFMTVRFEPAPTSSGADQTERRLIVPGLFSGPWSYLDHVVVPVDGGYVAEPGTSLEQFVYLISGQGRVQLGNESAEVGAGDAVPVRAGERCSFEHRGDGRLELMVVGIALG
jgi:uncharacterized cupin superfamily protein